MSTVRSEKDLKLLVMMFLGAMALYMAHSLREYNCGRHWYKMGTARMVGVDVSNGDPNSFAATVVYSLPLLLPAWNCLRNSRFRWALTGYVGLAITCVLLTGSRMGLVGLCALASITVLRSKRRLAILLLVAMAAPLAWKSLPADRQNRFLTLIDPSYGPANAQESAESRWQGWHDGVRIWQERPLFGAGPGGFGLARGYDLESHHLYGQILGELGTLGAVTFGMVVVGLFANYLAMRRLCRREPALRGSFPAQLIQSVTIAVVLLLLLGLAGHSLYRYTWLWYGAFQAIALNCLVRQGEQLAYADSSHAVDLSPPAAGQYGAY
jgi:O-antigen ligase